MDRDQLGHKANILGADDESHGSAGNDHIPSDKWRRIGKGEGGVKAQAREKATTARQMTQGYRDHEG